MDAKKLRASGDHSLLLGFAGVDIPIVRAPSGSPSFGSFTIDDPGASEFKSEYDHSCELAVHTLYNGRYRDVILCDRFERGESVFIRRCIASRRVSFSFSFENQVRRFFTKPLNTSHGTFPAFCTYIPASAQIDGFNVCGHDRFLLTAFCGEAELFTEMMTGCFNAGESYMIVCADTDPDRMIKRALSAISRCAQLIGNESPPKMKKAAESDAAEHLNALISLTSKEGFILSDANEVRVDPITQYFCVRAFLHAGMPDRALAIIDAYYNRFAERGQFLWLEKGGGISLDSACPAAVTNALVVLAALSLPKDMLGEKHHSMIHTLMKQQRDLLSKGMLPFNGNEDTLEARYLTYQGSALSTMLFIESAREFCRRALPADAESIALAADEAMSGFHRNFVKDGSPLISCPTRDISHARPRYKFGYCENCAPRSADPRPCWTHRTAYGVYLCPDCLGSGASDRHPVFVDPSLRRISYTTVLIASLIGSSIYPRGLVRQIAASLIMYPENEIKSQTGAALLAYVARRYELDGKYIDRADSLLRDSIFPADLFDLTIDGARFSFYTTSSLIHALMYVTYELISLPKKVKKKVKNTPNLLLEETT